MNNTRSILTLITILILMGGTFISCYKPKCKDRVETSNLIQSDKDLIPYKGNEILTFIRTNTNDTHVFVGEPKWTSYSNSSYGGADCSIETKREGRGIGFVSNTFNKPIVLNQYIAADGNAVFEVKFQNMEIFTNYLYSDSPFQKIQDSITIQGKKYYNIYSYANDAVPRPTNYGCLYTRTEGIIKLFFTTGETWELLNKQ